MNTKLKSVIALFAVIGIVSTGAVLSNKAFAQSQTNEVGQEKQEKEDQEKGEAAEGMEQDGPMTPPSAKFSPVQAMKAAEGKVGGKAVMVIFEFDAGKWNYGVIVAKNHKLTEVDVDPKTGKAGASEAVTPEDEAVEFKDALTKLSK